MTDELIPDGAPSETPTGPAEKPVLNFMEDLKAYIEGKGYGTVYMDYKPDSPDNVISVFVYSSMPALDGGITRRVQTQVRNTSVPEAYRIAHELAVLFDSGLGEDLIWLSTDRWAVCRPTSGARHMGHDNKGRPTYYIEFAASGDESP